MPSTKKAPAARRAAGAVMLQSAATRNSTANLAITIQPGTLKTLASRGSAIKTLVETLGHSIEHSQSHGQPGGFVVRIDAKGNPAIAPLPAEEPKTDDERLETALGAARDRGRLWAADVLSGSEMLSAEAFADRLGVSRMTVNARRQRHELLALDGAKRGFRFPAWQVDETGKPFEALPELFALLGGDAWSVYRFLTQSHAALDGLTGLAALQRRRSEDALGAARALAHGAFA